MRRTALLVAAVRAATARFHRFAVADDEGYDEVAAIIEPTTTESNNLAGAARS
jgi:hypothetical protein